MIRLFKVKFKNKCCNSEEQNRRSETAFTLCHVNTDFRETVKSMGVLFNFEPLTRPLRLNNLKIATVVGTEQESELSQFLG